MNSYDAIVSFLVSRRLVRPSMIVRGEVRVYDASRRNHNLRVALAGGRGFFVKIGADHQRRGTLASEARTYRFFQRVLDPTLSRSLLVKLRMFDHDASVLVLDLVESETLLDLQLRRGQFAPGPLAVLGRGLGRLHRQLLTSGRVPSGCGVFHPFAFELPRPTSCFINTYSAANYELIKIVQNSASILAGLEVLISSWHRIVDMTPCLIHGDLRFENTCIDAQSRTLRVVDWELAARGDPLWDIGAALAELISLWLLSIPIPTGANPVDCLPFATMSLDALHCAARAFWRAYAKARGLNDEERAAALRRAVLFDAAARLIQLAFERLQGAPTLTMHAVSHLQLSENLLSRPIDGAAYLFGFVT